LMSANFPTIERNEILRRIREDPRTAKQSQLKSVPPTDPPVSVVRSACLHRNWSLKRRMPGYVVQVADQSIGGKAPKWIIQGPGGTDDFYIAKLGATNGHIEVLTELFNNLLGDALGFDIAHHGIAKLDSQLYFVTQNFRNSEALIHGSLLVADVLASDPEDLDQIAHRSEQEFYSVDFIHDAINKFCG